MIFLVLLLICSNVVKSRILEEAHDNRGTVDLSKYCLKSKNCREGEHVMCMYYSQELALGWLCQNGSSVPITPEMSALIVDTANEMRAKIASGKEIGLDGEHIGKAFGMMELEWNEELALFAQVWANQCTRRYDYCRSTAWVANRVTTAVLEKKQMRQDEFETPSQLVATTRFTYPDWALHIPSADEIYPDADIPGLTRNKLFYAIKNIMKTVYLKKDDLTKSILLDLPDFTQLDHIQPFVGYLTMINVNSTHMGCGMSHFVDYYTKIQGMEDILSNVVLLVCNFSKSLRKGSRLIENKTPNSTENCGCPPGHMEWTDCLCIPVKRFEERQKEPFEDPDRYSPSKICDPDDPNCQSSVIILPIITVENAPSEELFKEEKTDPRRFGNVIDMKYFDKLSLQSSGIHQSGEDFNAIYQDGEHVRKQNLPSQNQQVHYRKNSIFTRASKFELPQKHRNPTSERTTKKTKITKNTLQDIATAYLEKQRSKEAKIRKPTVGVVEFSTKLPKNEIEMKNNNIEADNKLLKLLDNLEKEVKNVHLNSNIKDKINAKIRKIYGNIVDDHEIIAETKANKDSRKVLDRKYPIRSKFVSDEIDDDVLEHTALEKRQQNSIMQYEDPIYEHYDIFDYNESPDHFDRSYENYYRRGDGYSPDKKAMSNYYVHDEEDLLRAKKKKYYKQKLENIERQLITLRSRKHNNVNRPSDEQLENLFFSNMLCNAYYSNFKKRPSTKYVIAGPGRQ